MVAIHGRIPTKVRVWAPQGSLCATPAACRELAQNDPGEAQQCTLGGPRPRTAATIERERKERNLCQEREKARFFALPILGLPPFVPVFSGFCSLPRMTQLGRKLMATNVGLSRTIVAKSLPASRSCTRWSCGAPGTLHAAFLSASLTA